MYEVTPESARIRLESLEGFPVIAIAGELDISNSAAVDQAIALLDAESFVVLSLELCTFLDSTVLSVLIRRHLQFAGSLIIVLPDESPLGRIFDITGLRDTFRFVSNRKAALELALSMRDVGAVYFSRDGMRAEFLAP